MAYHDEIYIHYAEAVPSLHPLPWRYLSKVDTTELIRSYHETLEDEISPNLSG